MRIRGVMHADEVFGPEIDVKTAEVGQKYAVTTRETRRQEAYIATEDLYLQTYDGNAHRLMKRERGVVVDPQHFIGTLEAKYDALDEGYALTMHHPLLVFHVEKWQKPWNDNNGNMYFLAYEPVITTIQSIAIRAFPVAEKPRDNAGGGSAAAITLHAGERRWTFR